MTGLISAGADLITVLADICTSIGAAVMLLWTLAVLSLWLAMRTERKHAEVPGPGEWVDGLGKCPWCTIRQCTDPGKCHCDRPCGMSLCQAPEVEAVP